MIQRYARGSFTKTYKKTIGVDFLEKQLRVQSEEVDILLDFYLSYLYVLPLYFLPDNIVFHASHPLPRFV